MSWKRIKELEDLGRTDEAYCVAAATGLPVLFGNARGTPIMVLRPEPVNSRPGMGLYTGFQYCPDYEREIVKVIHSNTGLAIPQTANVDGDYKSFDQLREEAVAEVNRLHDDRKIQYFSQQASDHNWQITALCKVMEMLNE